MTTLTKDIKEKEFWTHWQSVYNYFKKSGYPALAKFLKKKIKKPLPLPKTNEPI